MKLKTHLKMNQNRTRFRQTLALLLIATLPFLALSDAPTITSATLGNTYPCELSNQEDSRLYFKLLIPSDIKGDISVLFAPKDPKANTIVAISYISEYPNGVDPNGYYSRATGVNIIDIPLRDLQAHKVMYVAVSCTSEACDGDFRIDNSGQVVVHANTQITLDFKNYQEQIVRIIIPNDTSIDHILINVEVQNIQQLNRSINVFINKGNTVPDSRNSDVTAAPSSPSRATAVIWDDESAFCVGCNYTVLIEAEPQALVFLAVRVIKNLTHLGLGQIAQDAVDPDESALFEVDITGVDPNHFLYVFINVYEGMSFVYMNPETLPKEETDFQWQLTTSAWSKFVFSPADRRAGNLHNKLYIRITGVVVTTFELKVVSSAYQGGLLMYGRTDSAYVLPEELVNYYLIAPDDPTNRNITVTLDFWYGHANLYLKSCLTFEECQFTKAEIEKFDQGALTLQSDKYPIRIIANNSAGHQVFGFAHQGSKCPRIVFDNETTDYQVCLYSIAVVGSKDVAWSTSESTHYELTASIDQTIFQLKEGFPQHASLLDQAHLNYRFTITNDTGVESVDFILTSISGTAVMYVSKTTKYPSFFDIPDVDYVQKDGKLSYSKTRERPSLTGDYYIAVYGDTACSFILTPVVHREGSTKRSTIPLMPGKIQKDEIKPTDVAYYSFRAANLTNATDLEILVTPLYGKVTIYVGEAGQPVNKTVGHYLWSSSVEALIINGSEIKPTQDYIIAVYPDLGPQDKKLESYSYKISVQYVGRPIHLEVGAAYSEVLQAQGTRYLQFDYFQGEGNVLVLMHPGTSEVILSASIGYENPNPNSTHNTATTWGKHDRGLLNLTKQSLEEHCHFTSANANYRCPVYLGLAATEDAYYESVMILVYKTGHPNKLIDGAISLYPAIKNEPIHAYFFPKDLVNSITIDSQSYWGKVDFFANIVQVQSSQQAFIDLSKYPTSESFSYASNLTEKERHTGSFFNELFIDSLTLRECSHISGYTCVVLITAYASPVTTGDYSSTSPYFTISATSELTPIQEGVPVTGSTVAEDEYRYYYFKSTKPNATIYISCTSLTHQTPTLLASLGKNKRPRTELQNWDFMSDWFSSDIQISPEDMEDYFQDKVTTDGDWIIGVYSSKPTGYQLVVYFLDSHVISLSEGFPLDLELQKGTTRSFSYVNYLNSSFSVRFMPQFGSADIYVTNLTQGQFPTKYMPNSSFYRWSTDSSNTRNRVDISKTDIYFCRVCRYLITVGASSKTIKGSLVITYENGTSYLLEGRSNHLQVSSGEPQIFQFFRSAGQSFDIDFVLFAGTIKAELANSSNFTAGSILEQQTSNAPFSKLTTLKLQSWVYYLRVTAISATANVSVTLGDNNNVKQLADSQITYGLLNSQRSTKFTFYNPYENSNWLGTRRLEDSNSVHRNGNNYRFKIMINVYNDDYSRFLLQGRREIYDLPKVNITEVTQVYTSSGKLVSTINLPALRNYSTYHGLNSSVRASETLIIDYQNKTVVVNGKEGANHLEIDFLNTADHPITYSIVVKTNDIVPLPLNTPILSRTLVDDFEIFEISSYTPGTLVIEVFECFGKVSFAATTSLNNLKKNQFELEVRRASETLYGELKIGVGVVYIKVKAYDGFSDDDSNNLQEAMYKIQARLFPSEYSLPYALFFPGMSGKMEYSFDLDHEKLKLNWHGLSADEELLEKNFQLYNVSVMYKLVLTTDPVVNEAVSKCSVLPENLGGAFRSKILDDYIFVSDHMYFTSLEGFRNKSEIDFYATFSLPPHPIDLYASLIAIADGIQGNHTVLWELPVFYKPSEIKYPGKPRAVFALGFVISIVVVLIILAGVFMYFHRKYKATKKRLTFEMQDIRNIADGVNVDIDKELPKEIKEKVEKKSKERYLGLNEEQVL